MKLKYLVYAVIFLTPILACSQRHTDKTKKTGSMVDFGHLKRFDQEPIYHVRINTPYTYTILINGIPIANKYMVYLKHYLVPINPCIPAKGTQNIEIQIYPRYIDEVRQNARLENDIDFELTIEKTAWKDGSLEEPEIIYRYILPEAVYQGKKALIHKDAFTADVPYHLFDWRKGKTFDVQDSANLKRKLMQAYEKLIDNYENQQGEAYQNAVSKGLFNLYQASYFDKKEALEHTDQLILFINKRKRKLAEIKNYRLEILADGKLAAFKRIDGHNKEEGVIRRYYQKGPKQMVSTADILFYIPPSSSEEQPLEVIWYYNLVKDAEL